MSQPQAILIGLALGDAIGYPTEFIRLPQIKARYGQHGIQEPPDPALYSDDTQMTVALAKGILAAGVHAPIDSIMEAIGAQFITWSHSPENNRAPGNTCMAGVRNYENGLPWHESGLIHSKGCGSAMRTAPIGWFYREDDHRLKEIAIASSVITHRHPAAIAASVAAAYLVKLALSAVPVDQYIQRTLEFTDGISDEFHLALLKVGHVLGWGNEEAALDHLGEGWVGDEAVALALYCILRYPDDYLACVRRAANTNGDSDSIACIAGGIMGARLGLEAIPLAWRQRCEHHDSLLALGMRMSNV
ncbi:MAG: ADP-ribosylglycohydrolase family protein [Anaerolineae bacterium]|jgi:ADP-ribosylglycohydrolase|nr:ADP-ribosylglycohydrolase family protein [Anaerolineae bacterium]